MHALTGKMQPHIHTYRATWDKKYRNELPAVSLSPAASICFSFLLVLWNNLHSVAGWTEALFELNGAKAEGRRGGSGSREGDAPAVGGTRQQNSISHVGWGRRRGHRAVGAAHSGIVMRGGGGKGGWWDAADKVWRNGSFPQLLLLEKRWHRTLLLLYGCELKKNKKSLKLKHSADQSIL